jgi:uncharacterized delta-60 repeat protein
MLVGLYFSGKFRKTERLLENMKILPCAAVLSAALAASSFAVPGDIDPLFNVTGKLRTSLGGGSDQGQAVARQSDGRLVVVGESQFLLTGYDFILLRFNANGTPDGTFGTAGQVRTAITTGDDYATAVAILGSGKIMVAGRSGNNLVLARYNADGSIDTTFGSGTGRILRATSSSTFDAAMAVQSDGKSVVLVGTAVYRFNTDGTLDTTFSGDGIATAAPAARRNIGGGCEDGSYYFAIALEGNGKIVIAGATTAASSCYYTDVSLVRFNADGSRDASFGTNGMAVAPHTADRHEYAYGIAFVAPNTDADHIVLVGSSDLNLGLWSFNRSDGSMDTTFGNGGRVTQSFGSNGGTGVAIQKQTSVGIASAIIVSGTSGNSFVTARFTLNGALDTTFAGGVGYARTNLSSDSSGSLANMIVPADNKPVAVGEARFFSQGGNTDLVLLRYTAAGVLDATFDGDGARTEDIGEIAVPAHSILPQPDGKLIAVTPRYLARFNADGSLDTSFDADGRVVPSTLTATALLQPDGKILVSDNSFRLARYNADGSLDFDFSGSTGGAPPNAIALQPDGKILLAGSVSVGSVTNFYIRRFLANGANDASFTNTVTPLDSGSDLATSIAVQRDGRIVAAGTASGGVAIIRCNPDGSLDPSFSFDGKQFLSALGGSAPHVKLAGDKIYVSGFQHGSSTRDFSLVRLNADGSLDTSFDGDGVATAQDASLNDDATDLAVQADGKILVAGYGATTSASTPRDFVIVRFNSNGSVDTSYGNNGRAVLDFQSNSDDSASAVAFDTIGRAVLAGQSDGFLAIARLIGDPFAKIVSIARQSSNGHIIVDGLASRELAYYLQEAATLNPASFQYYSFLNTDAAGVWRFDLGMPTSPHFYRLAYP